MKECPTCHRCFPDEGRFCSADGNRLVFTVVGEPVLEGRYQLRRRLGEGGMGMVYKARHILLKTTHAIKVILPELVGNDPSFVTRFRQEAMAAAAIRHHNVIAVTDYGVAGGQMPFLVMEYIQGKSLNEILTEEGRLSPERALDIMEPIVAGIGAAHRRGIVHRDLKPLNIMVEDEVPIREAVKVLDFGLAKIKSGELLGSFVAAKTTGLMGSPYYMAPEQWSDEEPEKSSDIYSLGIILYQMLAGDVPFKGPSLPSIMKKHLMEPPPPFAELGANVPSEIEDVVRHALEKSPEARPATVQDFFAELRDAVAAARRRLESTQAETLTAADRITRDQLAGTISDSEIGQTIQQAAVEGRREAEEARRRAEEQERLKREEQERLKREEEERLAREAEARRAEEEARRRREEEEEAARLAEAERRRREEEERVAAELRRKREEEEARQRAEEEARLRAEEEARLRAEEEARQRAEQEQRRRDAEAAARRAQEERLARERERQRLAEEERRKAEEEEAERQRAAAAEAARLAEQARRAREEEEERLRQEELARQRAEEEARQRAAEEAAARAAEQARLKREEEERLKREEEERLKREEEARLKREEEARLKREEQERLKREAEEKREREEAERLAREAEARRVEEEEARRRRAEEEESLRLQEEARRREEEQARLRAGEDQRAAREQEEAEQRRRAAEVEEEIGRVVKGVKRQRNAELRRAVAEVNQRREDEDERREEEERRQEEERREAERGDYAAAEPWRTEPVVPATHAAIAAPTLPEAGVSLSRADGASSQLLGTSAPPSGGSETWAQSQVPLPPAARAGWKRSYLPAIAGGAAAFVLLIVIAPVAYYMQRGESPAAPGVETGGGGPPDAKQGGGVGSGGDGKATKPPAVEEVTVNGGTFMMGRDDVNPASVEHGNQYPAHNVPVKSFGIDKTEVTNAEYAEFVRATGHAAPRDEKLGDKEAAYWKPWTGGNPPAGQERWPVRNVTLKDAEEFAAWRSKRHGVAYRLPTEEEWEFAARSRGQFKLYPWGDRWIEGYANVDATLPQPVGSHPAGATSAGALDMIGNVWEWTSTRAAIYPGNDKIKLDREGEYVIRGGSYQSKASGGKPITATWRSFVAPTTRHPTIGFRLVRPAP